MVRRVWWPLIDTFLALFFLAQILLLTLQMHWEDAYISFRYARNLALGHGLVYNPGEYVEGISNLLWTVLHAGLYRAGLSMLGSDLLLSGSCGLITFLLCRKIMLTLCPDPAWLARAPLVLLVCNTNLTASFGNGLEGSATGAALAALILGALWRNPAWITLGGAALLWNRAEGFVFVGIGGLWLLESAWRGRISRRAALCSGGMIVLCFAALMVFRAAYFGDLIPNTIRAKSVGLGWDHLSWSWVGTTYLADYARSTGWIVFLIAVAALANRTRRDLTILIWGLIGANLFIVWTAGGDWMVHYRLLTPFYPLLTVLCACGLSALWLRGRKWGYVGGAACILSAFSMIEASFLYSEGQRLPSAIKHASVFREDRDGLPTVISPNLRTSDFGKSGDRFLAEWGGIYGWVLRDHPVIEMWGLTDRDLVTRRGPYAKTYARAGTINWPEIFKKEPSYLVFSQNDQYVSSYCMLNFMKEIPDLPSVLRQYLLVQRAPFSQDPGLMNQLVIRDDRPALPLFLLDYGYVSPVQDYLQMPPLCPPGEITMALRDKGTGEYNPSALLTPWHQQPWVSSAGERFNDTWRSWKESQKMCSGLPYSTVPVRYTKELIDQSPLIFLCGNAEPSKLSIRCFLRAGDVRTEIGGSVQSPPLSPGDFCVRYWGVSPETLASSTQLELEIQGEGPGIVQVACFRWTQGGFPEFPSYLVIDGGHQGGGMAWLCLEQARQYEAQGRPDAARRAMERARDWPGHTATGVRLLGEYYEQQGRADEALALYQKSAAELPRSYATLNALYRLSLQTGTAQDTMRLFETLRQHCPWSLLPEFFIGLSCSTMGDTAKAEKHFRAALKKSRHTVGDDAEFLEAICAAGDTLFTLGNSTLGMAYYQRAKEYASNPIPVRLREASGLERLGRTEEALSLYREAIEQVPQGYDGYERISAIYIERNDLIGLKREWEKAVHKQPGRALSWYSLGLAEERLGENDAARAAYEQALVLAPEAPGTQEALRRVRSTPAAPAR